MVQPLNILQVFVRRNVCQLRCKHCSAYTGPKRSATVPLETAREIFSEVAAWSEANRNGVKHLFLQWSDDELFCEEDVDLHEYVALLSGSSVPAFSTNGIWLSSLTDVSARNQIQRLKSAGKAEVQLSFHGLASTHDLFVGRHGAFNVLVRTLRLAADGGLKVRCQIFANRENGGEIEDLYDFLLNTHVVREDAISFPVTNYVGRAKTHEDLRMDTASLDQLPKRIIGHFAALSTETELAGCATEAPDKFWRKVRELMNPSDRVCLQVTRDKCAAFTTCFGCSVPLGRLATDSFSEMLNSVAVQKAKDGTRLAETAQRAIRYADLASRGLYAPVDCCRLWLERMQKSNKMN